MLRLGIFAGLLSLSGACLGAPWYAEVAYTASKGDLPNDNEPLSNFDTDNSDSGWKLGVGYQTSENLSLELTYADFGEQTLRSRQVPGAIANPESFFNPFTTNFAPRAFGVAERIVAKPSPVSPGERLTAEAQGIQLAAIGRLPLSERFSLTLQGGAFITRYTNTIRSPIYRIQNGGLVITGYHKESGTSHDPELFAGLGLSYDLTTTMGLELSWEKIIDVGDEDTLQQDLDTYNLALRYYF